MMLINFLKYHLSNYFSYRRENKKIRHILLEFNHFVNSIEKAYTTDDISQMICRQREWLIALWAFDGSVVEFGPSKLRQKSKLPIAKFKESRALEVPLPFIRDDGYQY